MTVIKRRNAVFLVALQSGSDDRQSGVQNHSFPLVIQIYRHNNFTFHRFDKKTWHQPECPPR